MTGLACGCKLTAVPILLLGVPIVAVILRRFSLKDSAVFLCAALLVLAPWLIRNQVWAGNPVFPEAAKLLGQAHLTDAQVARWTAAHQPELGVEPRLKAVWGQLLGNWRWGFSLLPLGLIAVAVAWRRPGVKFLATLLLVQAVFWLGITHVQGRFLILAAPMVAMLIAQVDSRRWVPLGIGFSTFSAAVGWFMLGRVLLTFPPSIGVENFEPILRASVLPDAVASRIYGETRPVVLVGEARAFMFSIPMSRLHYRTVFDVVDWVPADIPQDALIVVNPVELRRLGRSYTNLPPLPSGIEDQDMPFILQR